MGDDLGVLYPRSTLSVARTVEPVPATHGLSRERELMRVCAVSLF
jgi:hypothetical protein